MAKSKPHVIVVGCGIGGMAAAVSALEQGAQVTVLERAPQAERGGQTRYTEAYFRMKSHDEVSDDFEDHLAQNASGYVDPSLVHLTAEPYRDWPGVLKALSFNDPEFISAFAAAAGPTVRWLEGYGIRFDFLPTQFLTKSQPRLLPVGGGLALVESLGKAAEDKGARFEYETAATDLLRDADGKVVGVKAVRAARTIEYRGDAVVLACGGFEGNTEMQTRYIGPRSVYLRPVCRGGYYNRGEGIQMALAIGAAPCGEYGSYHAEPVDPRSGIAEPSVFIFPYGILVNREGRRFTDEAPGTVDAYYERITRQIYAQSMGLAWTILDARHLTIPNYQLGRRSDQPPVVAGSIAELAAKIEVEADVLQATVAEYNRACRTDAPYRPLELDGLATTGLRPAKSNWAHPLDQSPYHAYPVISSNVFTFGGLKVDVNGRVLNSEGDAIPGLYAAGEIIGTYYGNYTGATSVLKGAVFGRLAGADATRR